MALYRGRFGSGTPPFVEVVYFHDTDTGIMSLGFSELGHHFSDLHFADTEPSEQSEWPVVLQLSE